jgi:hypothetical protein
MACRVELTIYKSNIFMFELTKSTFVKEKTKVKTIFVFSQKTINQTLIKLI